MCGIAAGTPAAGVRLGDIVSATAGIVDYGHLRATNDKRVPRRTPGDISMTLLSADHRLDEGQIHGRRPWEATLAAIQQANPAFRPPQPAGAPTVHRGVVGSADVLLRDARLRDTLADEHRIIAFEMEASGIATAARLHGREWFMVRGVSDLADHRKNNHWHGYAAAAAAAYLHALLGMCKPAVSQRRGGPGTVAAMSRIVEAMLAVRQVREEHERQRLVDELPGHIRSGIPYSPTARTHVITIVRACEDFPDGRTALLDALRLLLDAKTPQYAAVEEAILDNWPGS